MAEQKGSEQLPNESPAIIIKLPGVNLKLTGRWTVLAIATLLLVFILIVYLVSLKTEPKLWASGALWILFIGYWGAAASNAAPTKTSESVSSRQLHQLLMYGALALAFFRLPGLGHRWLPMAFYIIPLGLAIHISSILLAVWARRYLGRNWSGEITAKVDHRLIRTGPYRIVRHPIYSAMLGMFLGTAIVSGELHGLLAVVIIAAAYWRKIRLEEQHLRSVFGAEYDDYRRKSWALIPGLL